MISPYRSCFDVQLVVTRRAFIALERPVGMVDWMLGHPFSNADLALDHAALKGDVALVAVGDDFFDTVSGASRQNMTENGNKRHEHQAFLAPAVPTCKADASRGDGRAFGRCVDQRLCARGLGCISPHHANEFLDVVAFTDPSGCPNEDHRLEGSAKDPTPSLFGHGFDQVRRYVDMLCCSQSVGSWGSTRHWIATGDQFTLLVLATMQHHKLLRCQIGATPHLDSVRYRG